MQQRAFIVSLFSWCSSTVHLYLLTMNNHIPQELFDVITFPSHSISVNMAHPYQKLGGIKFRQHSIKEYQILVCDAYKRRRGNINKKQEQTVRNEFSMRFEEFWVRYVKWRV